MSFKKSVMDNIVTPATQNKLTNAMGTIIRYNTSHNVADVNISLLNSGTGKNLYNVPVQLSGTGIHSSYLQEGDTVYLQFNNGSIFQPKIIGKADEYYATNTKVSENHLRKGELAVSQEELEGDVTPSSDSWIDSTNTKLGKYYEYKYKSGMENVASSKETLGQFKDQEVGIYNPVSSSLVKIMDDGTINIFASTNIGIRVNPNDKTVEILGNSTTKSDNWTVISNTVEIKAKDSISIETKELKIQADKITRNGEAI